MAPRANAFVAILLLATAARPAEAPVRWFRDLKQGSDTARESARPMLIDFWADWCEPCKRMDAEVYSDPAIGGTLQRKFVPVRINFDIHPELARAYHVQAIPHLVVTDSLGTELIHHRGYMSAMDMVSLVEALPSDVSELNSLDQALRRDRNNFVSLVGMARLLRQSAFFESSSEYYERALKQDWTAKSVTEREAILREMASNYLELKDGRHAAPVLERYLREVPANEHTAECLLKLAEAYVIDGQRAKAEAAVRKLQTAYPETDETRKARALMSEIKR